MLPENLHEFLIASVGASASFIGLLFVALTLVLGRVPEGSKLAAHERTLATSSYTALITVFFISMVGLIPGAHVGWAMFGIGWLGIGSSLRLAQGHRNARRRDSVTVVGSLALVYIALAGFGLYSALQHDDLIHTGMFFFITFALYVVALGRAWSLIGVEEDSRGIQNTH